MASRAFVVYLSVLFLLVYYTDRSNSACTSKDCRKNACDSSCPCLGYFVDCSKKNLDAIPNDIPEYVEMLDLQNNNIRSISENALHGLKNLTELDLSNNELLFINSSILQQLTSLRKLVMNRNRLTEMPDLGQHLSLSTLSLQHNEIHWLHPSVLERFPNLTHLDLSYNLIADLPAETFGFSASLEYLSLSHNRIANIEKGAFDNLTALTVLKLNKNKLVTIPKELFRHLSSLRHLELNSNSLTVIQGLNFHGLMSLVTLRLRHNLITHLLDGATYGLNSIKKLYLDYNRINIVTKGSLYGLNSLERLYLDNNNISVIEDDAWDSGKRLLELDMTKNKLQYITTKTFDKLYSLKRLILRHNMITYIEDSSFRSLSALQYLELEGNEVSLTIEDSSKAFAGLERLRFLGLANNKIRSIVRRVFTGLSRLETLNLTGNQITTIEEDSFELPQLHQLLLNTSSLLCDCKLSWITTDFQYPITAECGYPEKMKHISVYKFRPEDFVCEGLPKPVIVKDPMTKSTLKGQNVTLHCLAESSDLEAEFFWRKDGKLLPSMRIWTKSSNNQVGDSILYTHTSSLFIENIQHKDAGRYQCVVYNKFGSVYSNKALITVHVYPVFTKIPVDVSIKSGHTARLECGAKGQPQPNIAWKKDGGEDFPAARERRMHVMPTDDIFFIVGVKTSDSGIYSCTAENVAGVITANATLTVLETPAFAKKMENKETKIGDTAVLECRASGNPKPNITWTKDGGPLIDTERHFFTGDRQLLVIDVTQYSDSGAYTCEMSNTLGTERGTSHLKILPASVGDENNMTGIIVIAVVVCVVGTSIVWVIVIHRTRKPREDFVTTARSDGTPPAEIAPFTPYRTICSKDLKQSATNIYLDSHSGHSKDSGTGDSAQPSSDDLLIEEDDHGLLLNLHASKRVGVPRINSLLALQDSIRNSQTVEPYASSNSSVSKEQVPLLHSFRTSRSPWKNHRKSISEFRQHPAAIDWYAISCGDNTWPCAMVQRSMSADQVNTSDVSVHHRGCSEPPQDIVTRVDSSGIDRDSGFPTFPRSVTQASVSNWNTESPRLHRLPKAVPNDSGSFSIASEEVQILTNPAKCISNSILPTVQASRISKSCTGMLDQKAT